MELGERLKVTRQQHGQTQQAVADQLHVARQTVSSWETGHSYPDLEELVALGDLYQLSLDTLLREDGQVLLNIRQTTVLAKLKVIRWCLVASNLGFVVIMLFPVLKVNGNILLLMIFNLVAWWQLRRFWRQLKPRPLLRQRYPQLRCWLGTIGLGLLVLGGATNRYWSAQFVDSMFVLGLLLLISWAMIATAELPEKL